MHDEIRQFLEHDGFFPGISAEWTESTLRLGSTAPHAFLETLRTGPESTLDAALIGLRVFGYEAWADGDDTKRTFRIRSPGETDGKTIDPLHQHPAMNEKYRQELMRGS